MGVAMIFVQKEMRVRAKKSIVALVPSNQAPRHEDI
jgi:hypothetical protein